MTSFRTTLRVGLAALALGATSCGPPADDPAPPRPNLVVILVDTLRPDRLDLYGYPRETAPFVTELGKDSVVFERAFSTSSWTAPSTASVFTGLYPSHHGVIRGFRAQRRQARALNREGNAESVTLTTLPPDVPTLPEMLQEAGYRTFGLTANVNVNNVIGFDRGFDLFDCQTQAVAEDIDRTLQDWETEMADSEPFFLYLHFNDVHRPYNKREPWYQKKSQRAADQAAAYESEISYLDSHLRRMFERYGWHRDENTLVMLLSDHGEEFMEHGQIGHHFTLHNEVNRVLMVLYAPQRFEPRRVDANVSLIDVVPTLLDLVGTKSTAVRDGTSLLPLLTAPDTAPTPFEERILFGHRFEESEEDEPGVHLWSALRGPWKLIDMPDLTEPLLYNHETDPFEQNDLRDEQPQLAVELAGQLDEFRAPGIRQVAEASVPITDALMRELDRLGYVDRGNGDPEEDSR